MINLWYEDGHLLNGKMTGPLKVILNLKESLNQCGIDYVVNQDTYDKNFLVHYDAKGHQKHSELEHNSCFIGPQFWPFDPYGQFLFDNPDYYNQLIVPSQWVKDLLIEKFNVNNNKVSIWPVGIKQSNLNRNVKYDCLLYSKRRSTEEILKAIDFLKSKNLSYNIISYGSYQESDFELLSSQSRFCFLVNGSESQGIAVQEMMSSNMPLFVWDITEWNDQGEKYKVSATSIPYWDSNCGEVFYNENEMEKTFSKFYDRMYEYNPQKFIEENLSYEKSVQILLEILNAN